MKIETDIDNNTKIVDALIAGDELTFEVIYKNWFVKLSHYSASIVMDTEIGKEIVQDLFLSLWINRKKLNKDKSLRNYLLRAVHNNSLAYLKRKSLHKRHEEKILIDRNLEEQENVMEYDKKISDTEILSSAIARLPEQSRKVVTMSYLEDKKHAKIAGELAISIRTVETILYKAMRKLRKDLKNK